MGKILKKQPEVQTSALRILGAAFFGFIAGLIIRGTVDYSIPKVLMNIHGIEWDQAYSFYSSSFFPKLVIGVMVLFFTAYLSGFLAKKSGVLVGVIANSLPILALTLPIAYVLIMGADPASVFAHRTFLQLVFYVLASIFGGLCGERCYSEKIDLDLNTGGLTIFGVYWMHYLWMPIFIFYPLISSVVILIYSWMGTFSTILDFLTHFNLWINLAWWFYFFINPLIIFLSSLVLIFCFKKFWRIMQYRQTYYEFYERVIGVIMYGIASPVLVRMISSFTVKATGNMSRPIINDWKISLGYILIIPIAGIIIRFFWWIKMSVDKSVDGKRKKT